MNSPPVDHAVSRQLLEIASAAALRVGAYLLEHNGARVEHEEKAGFYDPVTEYDRQAERLIAEHIFREWPDSAVVGEEGGRQGSGAVVWYVDPIDGTNNFVTGIPFFCISIAAMVGGSIVAGVVFDPVRNELMAASTVGAYLNGQRIRSSGQASDSTAVLSTGFPYSGGRASPEDVDLFGKLTARFRAVRRLGSTALELAYVACGRVDLTFQTNANPWDVAAGMLLVQQAGGRYLALGTERPDWDSEPWMSPVFIAACPEFDLARSSVGELLAMPYAGPPAQA